MGWWKQICDSFNGQSNIEAQAARTVGNIRRAIRDNNPDTTAIIHLEVMRLKDEIRITAEESGAVAYREALAIWQIAQTLYPDQITEADKPTLMTY